MECFDENTSQTSRDFLYLKERIFSSLVTKGNSSHINAAFQLLKHILTNLYDKNDNDAISCLVQSCNNDYAFTAILSQYINDAKELFKWSDRMNRAAFYVMKKILTNIGVNKNSINRIHHTIRAPMSKYDSRVILAFRYSKLSHENEIHIMLTKWIHLLRTKSKNHSPQTIRSIMAFYLNTCLPKLGLTLEYLANNSGEISLTLLTSNVIETLCSNVRKERWFAFLCKEILHIPYTPIKQTIKYEPRNYTGEDKHTISANELDLIYESSKQNALDELMFLLLITTGMRIGGLLNIKLVHICTLRDNEVIIHDTGRTLEKGNKWFDFVINPLVKNRLENWILNERKGNSEYLFPSNRNSSTHMATITARVRFKKVCEQAGLKGAHLHLHSLRHSYAHMLLKCGNSVNIISKLLNHSNTTITEKFYLRESITEVTNRANIPWIESTNSNEKIIPNFLNTQSREKRTKELNHKRERMDLLNKMLLSRV